MRQRGWVLKRRQSGVCFLSFRIGNKRLFSSIKCIRSNTMTVHLRMFLTSRSLGGMSSGRKKMWLHLPDQISGPDWSLLLEDLQRNSLWCTGYKTRVYSRLGSKLDVTSRRYASYSFEMIVLFIEKCHRIYFQARHRPHINLQVSTIHSISYREVHRYYGFRRGMSGVKREPAFKNGSYVFGELRDSPLANLQK
jgi:hypothetical protein